MEEKKAWDERLCERQGEEKAKRVLKRIAEARLKAIEAGVGFY
jgi:hypothetical protein